MTYGDNNRGRILGVKKIESLEEMHIHREDQKGKGDGNNEDFHIDEIKTNSDCWISPTVAFCSIVSSFKYIQGKSGLPKSALDRQVFKN